jgi:hypothetical protein
MTLIPRSEIEALMERHNDFWALDGDPPADVVRQLADDLCDHPDYEAEGRELHALVDRIEQASTRCGSRR